MQKNPESAEEANTITENDEMSDDELDKIDGGAGKGLDSKSEMGEMQSLRLQMAMDRKSKFTSTLSNVMSKVSHTGETITQNIK
jgi:hypothetical protein